MVSSASTADPYSEFLDDILSWSCFQLLISISHSSPNKIFSWSTWSFSSLARGQTISSLHIYDLSRAFHFKIEFGMCHVRFSLHQSSVAEVAHFGG
jgi:hypothetical protein